jgi:S1-C subfamily serine protease
MIRISIMIMMASAFLTVPASASEHNLGALFVAYESEEDPDVVESVMVEKVACNSPSSIARLRVGDLILGVNGQSIVKKTFDEYQRILDAAELSGVFDLTIWRAGGNIFSVTLHPAEHDGDYSCGVPKEIDPGL